MKPIDDLGIGNCGYVDCCVGDSFRPSQGYLSAVDSMTEAIFNERCPGINFDPRDRPIYERAARAALQALGIEP